MRLLLDESVNMRLAPFLQRLGQDVTGIAVDHPASMSDEDVLAIAFREDRVLITHGRDFGRLVFVKHQPHAGVILLRLGPRPRLTSTSDRLAEVLSRHLHELREFIVVTPERIRARR